MISFKYSFPRRRPASFHFMHSKLCDLHRDIDKYEYTTLFDYVFYHKKKIQLA